MFLSACKQKKIRVSSHIWKVSVRSVFFDVFECLVNKGEGSQGKGIHGRFNGHQVRNLQMSNLSFEISHTLSGRFSANDDELFSHGRNYVIELSAHLFVEVNLCEIIQKYISKMFR